MSRSDGAPLDFVIVGAQRAASTHLNACLRDHPQLFLCPDEVPFFEDPFFDSTPVEALSAVFAKAKPGQRRGIQRPDYLGRAECARHIRKLAPDARILAVLRDPVDRAVSAYFWYVQFGLLPLIDVNQGMARLLDGWTDPAYPRAGEILEYGFYGRHLSRYVDTFGADQVLALTTDELREPTGLPRVYAFLGADPTHRIRVREQAHNAGVYDMRRLRVLRARKNFAWSWDGQTVFRYRPRRLRRPLHFLPTAAIVGFDRLVLAKLLGNARPRLEPGLAARLRMLYGDDVRVLESLLSRDFAAWRRATGTPG
jgi:Sulfotransferase domain